MREFRMARAAALLADNSKVEWVTAELGYVNRSHFARDFKKYWGYPPSEHARRVNPDAARQSGKMTGPDAEARFNSI
jgi:YesN/AraC family two-component response regulator